MTELSQLCSYLKEEFDRRVNLNKRYSRKAFSRDLGISATCLNDFLAGRRALSFRNIDQIFKYLGRKQGVACSWCQTPVKKAKRMIGGARRQYICESCIEACNDILARDRKMGA